MKNFYLELGQHESDAPCPVLLVPSSLSKRVYNINL